LHAKRQHGRPACDTHGLPRRSRHRMFVNLSRGASAMKNALVILLALAPITHPLHAQAGRWDCRADSLSGFNCAGYYSGTVTLTSELRGSDLRQALRVAATVTGGRVSCQVSGSEVGEFEGGGMLVVAHEAALAVGGGYSVSVWCPASEGEQPRRGDYPMIEIMRQRAADYAVLEGRDEHEHPDADPTNGLSGTETITWSLRRQ